MKLKSVIAGTLFAISTGALAQIDAMSDISLMGVHLNMKLQDLPETIRSTCFAGGGGSSRFCVKNVTLDGITLSITVVLELQRVRRIWVFFEAASFDDIHRAFRAKYGKEYSSGSSEIRWADPKVNFPDYILLTPKDDYGHPMLSKEGRAALKGTHIGSALFDSQVTRREAEEKKQKAAKSLADKL